LNEEGNSNTAREKGKKNNEKLTWEEKQNKRLIDESMGKI